MFERISFLRFFSILSILQLVLRQYRFVVFVYLMLHVQHLLAEELVPLKIIVNTQDKGEYFVLLKANDDVLVNENDFKSLGIITRAFSKNIDGISYVSLNDMRDQLEYVIDEINLSLIVTANPASLQKTIVDLSQKTIIRSNPFGIDSAFLNYSFINRGNNREFLKSFEMPLEGVVSAHDMLLQTNFTYKREYVNGNFFYHQWSRGLTNITKDFPKKLNRLIMGDVPALSGELGGSGVYLGVSYRKKYSMATYLTKYPSVTVNGILRTPSKVNMYANGVLIRSQMLPPGEFSISNLPNLYGSGSLEMETVDAFGRVTRQEIPYYVSTRLLRVGLHDFMYTIGFKRDSLTARQPRYDSKPAILGYHRYGVNQFLTGGYRFEFSDKLKNMGISTNILLGPFGEVEAGLSVSDNQQDTGTAKFFRYGFTSRYLHGRYSYKQRSRYYNTLSNVNRIIDDTDAIQSVGVGFHGLPIGALSFGYDVIGNLSAPLSKLYSAIYSLRIAKQATLLVRGTRKEEVNGEIKNTFVVTLNAALGDRISGSANYSEDEDNIKKNAYLQKALPVGEGFGGRLRFERTEPKHENDGKITDLADGALKIKTRYLSINGDYFMGEIEDTYQSQFAGSLAFVDNDFYLTRPIQDSFGLAKVDGLDDVRVYFSNELVGKTKKGRLIIPNLVSYADNHISIEGEDVPVDRALKNTSKRLSPKFRTGSVALFDVERFQGFFGFIYLEERGKRKTADFARLILQRQDQSFDTVVGKGGEFYLENLQPGNYSAQIKLDGEVCQFKLEIPESEIMMVELGDHVCQM